MKLVTTEGREWSSSLIKHTEYNPDDQQLFIVFQNEAQYVYLGITKEIYNSFCEAESVGTYFGKNIRGKFDYAKIENGEVSEFVNVKEEVKNDNQEGA